MYSAQRKPRNTAWGSPASTQPHAYTGMMCKCQLACLFCNDVRILTDLEFNFLAMLLPLYLYVYAYIKLWTHRYKRVAFSKFLGPFPCPLHRCLHSIYVHNVCLTVEVHDYTNASTLQSLPHKSRGGLELYYLRYNIIMSEKTPKKEKNEVITSFRKLPMLGRPAPRAWHRRGTGAPHSRNPRRRGPGPG